VLNGITPLNRGNAVNACFSLILEANTGSIISPLSMKFWVGEAIDKRPNSHFGKNSKKVNSQTWLF
jgi:hypothetical protein